MPILSLGIGEDELLQNPQDPLSLSLLHVGKVQLSSEGLQDVEAAEELVAVREDFLDGSFLCTGLVGQPHLKTQANLHLSWLRWLHSHYYPDSSTERLARYFGSFVLVIFSGLSDSGSNKENLISEYLDY